MPAVLVAPLHLVASHHGEANHADDVDKGGQEWRKSQNIGKMDILLSCNLATAD